MKRITLEFQWLTVVIDLANETAVLFSTSPMRGEPVRVTLAELERELEARKARRNAAT